MTRVLSTAALYQFRANSASRRMPCWWLFSGWNCVPAMLSRWIAETNS
jgi:hypothetical protein